MTRNRSIILLLLIACVVIPSGWLIFGEGGGCVLFRQQTAEEKEQTEAEKRKEEEEGKEKEKPDFEPMQITILPGMMANETEEDEDETIDGTEEINGLETIDGNEPQGFRRVAAKPGHWVYARYGTTANNYDFSGQLTVECTDSSLNPIDLERSPYRSNASRPVVFPKGQSKAAELPVFVSIPPAARIGTRNGAKANVQLHAMLRPKGGRSVSQDYTPILRLKPHQYHIVVLAGDPDRYGYVRSLDTVKPPAGENDWSLQGLREDYVVTLHGVGENDSMLLPGNPLAWTSIAYLIWDDVPRDSLAPDQQLAMVDWLHWGGQLILSGPQTLDKLRDSFLADYLPAKSDRSAVATAEMLQPLNDTWSLQPDKTELDLSMYQLSSTEKRPLDITPLEPTEGSQAVPGTGGLVVERKVGRGRIAVTAFSLSNRNVVNWQNFDGFFNGCLLRRPGRQFRLAGGYTTVAMPGMPRLKDPRVNCGLRYFTRDAWIPGEGPNSQRTSLDKRASQGMAVNRRRAGLPPVPQVATPVAADPQSIERSASAEARGSLWGFDWRPKRVDGGELALSGYLPDKVGGVAGWSDFSAAGITARQSLQEAAGISVPEAGFVAKVLAGYLLCLVPVNWLLFKLLRRVEWAWFAAPVIAIAGAVGVVKLAQLDIGFVRSRTEIAILETQPGYARGHLTRYTGMYTSLTSDYALTFDDSNAVGMPFSTAPSDAQLSLQKQKGKAVPFVRDTKVALSGYPVLSNSTGMVHVEQMVELPGQLELVPAEGNSSSPTLRNGMEWEVKCAIAVHVDNEGVRMFPLGDLAAGAEVRLPNRGGQDVQPLLDQLSMSPTTTAVVKQGEVSLREMLRLAVQPSASRPGGWRVVGWTDQPVPGMEIEPAANQNLFRTVMVCHLDHGPLPQPAVDINHAVDETPPEDPFSEDFDDDNNG